MHEMIIHERIDVRNTIARTHASCEKYRHKRKVPRKNQGQAYTTYTATPNRVLDIPFALDTYGRAGPYPYGSPLTSLTSVLPPVSENTDATLIAGRNTLLSPRRSCPQVRCSRRGRRVSGGVVVGGEYMTRVCAVRPPRKKLTLVRNAPHSSLCRLLHRLE